MPPFINTDIIDGNVVAAEVLENSSSEEDDEIEEVLPEPVTNTHHFDFRRVQTRLRALLKLNAESYTCVYDLGDTEECKISYDIAVIGGAVRKLVRSSGDIWYVYGRQGSCGYTQVKWIGTEVGVCADCQNSDSLHHPLLHKKSIRTYPDVRQFGARIPSSHLLLFCAVEKCRNLCVYMQHGGKLGNIPSAVQRNSIMVRVHNQMRPPHLKSILSVLGKKPAAPQQLVDLKDSIMSELHTKCLCGGGSERARVWSVDDEVVQITSEDVTEMQFRQKYKHHGVSVTSCIRRVERPCVCLSACGHRNHMWLV